MGSQPIKPPLRRITDLVEAKNAGAQVTLDTAFEILPVEFHHRNSPFQAYIFLTRYRGRVDDQEFSFRKCYARGCPNNLCTHVSQAVNIANRYLARDRHALAQAGIRMPDTVFSLDDMVVKFENITDTGHAAIALPELAAMARTGKPMSVEIGLEFLPAVEHFASQQHAQTFLSGEFTATTEADVYHSQRCFACYETGKEESEKAVAIKVANARLKLVYQEFDAAGINYRACFFE